MGECYLKEVQYDRMLKQMKRIYMDFASATPIDARVARAIAKALTEYPGNPSSSHAEGRKAKQAIDESRTKIARTLFCRPEELVFTGGGTEANHLAIQGLVRALRKRGLPYKDMHIISSTIEHASILEALETLETDGVTVTLVPPNKEGIVEPNQIAKAVTEKTILVTLSHVNSEIGTIQPLSAISDVLQRMRRKKRKLASLVPETSFPILHADAAQSPLYLEAGPHALKADLVTYDAQKMMGPKGLGILYRDFSIPLAPILGGGTQERGVRPGTENTALIVGAGVAFEFAFKGRKERSKKIACLRDALIALVEKNIPNAVLIGSQKHRIANNADFAIPGVDGDYLTVLMDTHGVAVSPRSACGGTGGVISHVVYEVTGDKDLARGTIRFSLGPSTSKTDIEKATQALLKSLRVFLDKNPLGTFELGHPTMGK